MPRQTVGLQHFLKCVVLPLIFFLWSTATVAESWHPVAPGIEYRDLGIGLFNPWSHIYAFRIDLKKNQLNSLLASELDREHASVDEFSHFSKALITLNGGFFDRQFHPLGLRISQKKRLNPIKRISWWGIFYIKNNKPYLSTHRQFNYQKSIDFALQSGPRLIIKGKIPSLKPGLAERSALGITKDGKVILLATDNAPMTTTTLAKLMKSPPLNCIDALNLDGGSSTQLYTRLDDLKINIHGFSRVSDAIIVTPHNQ